ncbi:hypothetical protein AAY473_012743 [Plecturocebus cupreus]
MGPAEPVRAYTPRREVPGWGTGKTAAPAKRVALATRTQLTSINMKVDILRLTEKTIAIRCQLQHDTGINHMTDEPGRTRLAKSSGLHLSLVLGAFWPVTLDSKFFSFWTLEFTPSQLQCQLGDNTLQGWGKILQKAVYALNQYPIYGTVSPIARIYGSRNRGVEVEVAPLTITPRDPLAKFLLPIPVKKGVTVPEKVIDLDYQDEISLLLHSEGKEEHSWNTGDPLSRLLVLPCPVIKVNGKLQQPSPGRTTNGPDPLGMKVLVTPPGKKPQRAEVLAEGKRNTEWIPAEEYERTRLTKSSSLHLSPMLPALKHLTPSSSAFGLLDLYQWSAGSSWAFSHRLKAALLASLRLRFLGLGLASWLLSLQMAYYGTLA